jgi:3-methyladenine DNA glycosylase AlkD
MTGTMSGDEVLAALRAKGQPRTAEIYRRHGATGEVLGVAFADLQALHKKLGTDHALSDALWDSGVADARLLALMIADPAALTPEGTDRYLVGTSRALTDLLAKLVARTSFAHDKLAAWTSAPADPARYAGYVLLAVLVEQDGGPTDEQCARFLDEIARTIHDSPNLARHAMNMALIAIGGHRPALRDRAIEVAREVGPVHVDHGQTGCKTPDAEVYIRDIAARRGEKAPPRKRASRAKKPAAAKKAAAPAKKAAEAATPAKAETAAKVEAPAKAKAANAAKPAKVETPAKVEKAVKTKTATKEKVPAKKAPAPAKSATKKKAAPARPVAAKGGARGRG